MSREMLKELLRGSYLQGVMNHMRFNRDTGKEFSEILNEDFEKFWSEKIGFIDSILNEEERNSFYKHSKDLLNVAKD